MDYKGFRLVSYGTPHASTSWEVFTFLKRLIFNRKRKLNLVYVQIFLKP